MTDSRTDSRRPADTATVAPVMRVGGAFLLVSLVLFAIYGLVTLQSGIFATYAVSTRTVATVIAAAIAGAFFTVGAVQRATVSRSVALAVAVALEIIAVVAPAVTLVTIQGYWLPAYAVVCLIAGVVARMRATTASGSRGATRKK